MAAAAVYYDSVANALLGGVIAWPSPSHSRPSSEPGHGCNCSNGRILQHLDLLALATRWTEATSKRFPYCDPSAFE